MAGGLGECRYCRMLLAVVSSVLVVIVLAMSGIWNPLPGLTAWWDRFTSLSTPPPPWTARLGGVPDIAAVLSGGQVVASTRGEVKGYNAQTGQELWHLDSTWALPAGDVVVVRLQGQNPDEIGTPNTGYSVVDPATGSVLWGARDAGAVWAFADTILDLHCPDADHCELRAYAHRSGGTQLWRVPLPGSAHTMHGPNPPMLGIRDPAGWFAKAAAGTPPRLPTVIGFTIDGQMKIVDTVLRKVYDVPAQDLHTRVALAGERIIFARADQDGDSCRYSVTAYDVHDLKPAWAPADRRWDLGTVSGEACAQRHDPIGAGGYLVALDSDHKPMLVDGADGTPAWVGVPSERVLATDGRLAAILVADRHTVKVIDLLDPAAPVIWSQKFGLDPQAAITNTQVFVRDGDSERLWVFARASMGGAHTELKTSSVVVGYGPSAVVIASARRFGVIALVA